MKIFSRITGLILLALILIVIYIRTDVFVVIAKTLLKSDEFGSKASLSSDIKSVFYTDRKNPGTIVRLYKAGIQTEKLEENFFKNTKRFAPFNSNNLSSYKIKKVITISGSGTYHHHTLKFIKEISQNIKPEILYLIDAHSDSRKLTSPDKIDCGNWINELYINREKYSISKVIFLGGYFRMSLEGDRWLNYKLIEDNFMDIYTNPKKSSAYFKTSSPPNDEYMNKLYSKVKYARPDRIAAFFGHPGVWLRWKSLKNFVSENPDTTREKIKSYITVDMDVLDSQYISTEWGNGNLKSDQLLILLDTIKNRSHIVGADICGWSGKDDGYSIETIKKIYEHLATN